MKKSSAIALTIIVLIVLVGGGYALFHKSSNSNSNNSSNHTPNSGQAGSTPVNNAILTTKTDSSLGQYLADPSGKPLYTYGADTSGVSNCTGSCLTEWPAYVATASMANLPAGISTITRTDNHQIQYTYNDAPLYYFVDDSVGKVTGDGKDNFKVAKPAAVNPNQSTSPAPASNTQPHPSSSGSPY